MKFAISPMIVFFSCLVLTCLALTGCANNPDPYYNPPPLPPYGSNPSMDVGAVGPLAPPPAADGTY